MIPPELVANRWLPRSGDVVQGIGSTSAWVDVCSSMHGARLDESIARECTSSPLCTPELFWGCLGVCDAW